MVGLAELSRYLIPVCWGLWMIGWLLASIGNKRTRWRETTATAFANRAPVLIGAVMLMMPYRLPPALTHRFLSGAPEPAAIGAMLTLLGLLFSGWARWHLGRNWSGTVTVKQDHTLITSGPYRWVRHPIYTGMLVALFGTALAIGAAYGFIGAGLILFGFVLKLRVEEERMRATFPGEYARYSAHTARLIPGVY